MPAPNPSQDARFRVHLPLSSVVPSKTFADHSKNSRRCLSERITFGQGPRRFIPHLLIRLCLLTLGDIPGYSSHAGKFPSGILDGRNSQRDINAVAIVPDVDGVQLVDAFSLPGLLPDPEQLVA